LGRPKTRGRADRRHQVCHQRQVQHLLHRDAVERLAPPRDCLGLLGGQAIARAVLEAELREQVLAHDHVFELRGLGEQPPQVLPMRHHDPGFGHAPTLRQMRGW